jgi:hypothetical protein
MSMSTLTKQMTKRTSFQDDRGLAPPARELSFRDVETARKSSCSFR